ncbi:MarR family winged helix-turn-helix transcriptional regulator [Paractinoplanes maris]|uniref:MarR family winged helix-turn-helix transcriptional regulator n=1 Tax=Paractinoplanes maris TaxID=1734446 RepID=UPI002020E8E5|nr:MarR family transcriptional regulator [Actinoplanes maris]
MDDAPQPLTPDEERLWRAVNRMLFTLPKALDQDLQKLTGLNSSRYGILFNLSEAPEQTLRMNELAERTALSASRVSRVVDSLEADGCVRRWPAAEDGRGFRATLTPRGLARLQAAWPGHLLSARRRVMSPVAETGIDVARLTELVERIVDRAEAP